MRVELSMKLLLLFLLGNVRGRPDGVRGPASVAGHLKAPRTLQAGNNETQGEDPSDWFGGGEGGDTPAKNETVPSESSSPPVESLAPDDSSSAPAPESGNDNSTDASTTSAPTVNTQNPAGAEGQNPAGNGPDEPANPTDAPAETEVPGDPETDAPAETVMPTGDGDDDDVDDGFEDGDDDFEDEYGDEGEVEGEGWGDFEPEDEGTKAPYVPPTGDDPFATQPDESEWTGEDWKQETPEEMMHDKNVIIAVVGSVLFGFVLAICSAQQVIENPDGCCSSMCRCAVKFFCFFFKILCFPCRMCCGNKDRRSHDLMIGGSDSYTHDLELT